MGGLAKCLLVADSRMNKQGVATCYFLNLKAIRHN